MLRTMALFCGERTTHVFVPGCSLLFRRKADVHLDVIDFCISLSFYRLPEDHDFPAIHAGVPSLLLGRRQGTEHDYRLQDIQSSHMARIIRFN
jgi:hypothetical protein